MNPVKRRRSSRNMGTIFFIRRRMRNELP